MKRSETAPNPTKQRRRGRNKMNEIWQTWSLQHPENWDTSSVEGWISFVAEKYVFPEDIRWKCVTRLRDVTGKQLMGMQMTDFQRRFREIGELLYIAFIQIMDVGPDFEDRSKTYTEKIKDILDVLVQSDKVIKTPLWQTFPIMRWTTMEVNQWILSIVEENSALQPDCERLVEAFDGIDGPQLCSMSMEDIALLARDHTSIIADSLNIIREKVHFYDWSNIAL